MEQPLRRNQFDMNSPMEGDAGAMPNRGEVSRQAGHILLHESPHGGEISLEGTEQDLDPTKQVARTELPAWYNVKFNAINQVVEQDYGQAFQQEQRAEQVGRDDTAAPLPSGATPVVTPAAPQNPLQTQAPTIPDAPSVPAYATPVIPVPQLTTPLTASNPIYNAMAHPLQANQPRPIDDPSTWPEPAAPVRPVAMSQPLTSPLDPSYPGMPVPPSDVQPFGTASEPQPLAGGINPSFGAPQQSPATPMLPPSKQSQEPALSTGKRIDPQHLLPIARKHLSTYARSPWVWLAIGVLMILYFARSL